MFSASRELYHDHIIAYASCTHCCLCVRISIYLFVLILVVVGLLGTFSMQLLVCICVMCIACTLTLVAFVFVAFLLSILSFSLFLFHTHGLCFCRFCLLFSCELLLHRFRLHNNIIYTARNESIYASATLGCIGLTRNSTMQSILVRTKLIFV